MEQQIRFCASADGVCIAYGTVGKGPPLVLVPGWGRRIEQEWKHPDSRSSLEKLAAGKQFLFADRGETALRGFEEPVRLYEVRWHEGSATD